MIRRNNTIKPLFYTATIIALASSCAKNFLDTKINTLPTSTTINSSYVSLFSFANAPYGYLRNGFTILDNNLFASAGDEAQQSTKGATSALLFDQGGWNATNNPDNYYANYYAGIRAANYFLQNSVNYPALLAASRDTFSSSNKIGYYNDVQNIGWYRAEAHILRAWFYFELAKRYGGVPLVTSVLDDAAKTNLPATPYDSVVSFIVSEVDNNVDSLQANWATSAFANNDGRFTQGVALALKARALLFWASPLHNTAGDVTRWQKAASAVHDVITYANGAGNLALDPNYGSYFLQTNPLSSPETILAIRNSANNVLETLNYPIATPGGNSGEAPSQNLVSDYEYTGAPDPANPYTNRDPRLAYSIVTNGSTWNGRTIDESSGGTDDMAVANSSPTGYYLKKFLNDGVNLVQGGTSVHNWVVIRYGEVLLEYAEAMNEAYGPDNDNGYGLTAREALNQVRARVSMPPATAAVQTDFRTAVKHERRIELAFEDYRYWDLLRWKDAGTYLNMPIQGVKVTKANGTFSYQTVTVADRVFDITKMYYYPFPQTEISNSGGVLKQNPGW